MEQQASSKTQAYTKRISGVRPCSRFIKISHGFAIVKTKNLKKNYDYRLIGFKTIGTCDDHANHENHSLVVIVDPQTRCHISPVYHCTKVARLEAGSGEFRPRLDTSTRK